MVILAGGEAAILKAWWRGLEGVALPDRAVQLAQMNA
jgi:hypothetical protein